MKCNQIQTQKCTEHVQVFGDWVGRKRNWLWERIKNDTKFISSRSTNWQDNALILYCITVKAWCESHYIILDNIIAISIWYKSVSLHVSNPYSLPLYHSFCWWYCQYIFTTMFKTYYCHDCWRQWCYSKDSCCDLLLLVSVVLKHLLNTIQFLLLLLPVIIYTKIITTWTKQVHQ